MRWAVRFLLAVASLSVAVSPASAQSGGNMTITDCIDYWWMGVFQFSDDDVAKYGGWLSDSNPTWDDTNSLCQQVKAAASGFSRRTSVGGTPRHGGATSRTRRCGVTAETGTASPTMPTTRLPPPPATAASS